MNWIESAAADRRSELHSAHNRLEGRVVRRSDLDEMTRAAMFRLLAAHFVGVDRSTFDADLEEKQCAILLEDDDGELRGFSTLLLYRTAVERKTLSVVYSGDTIVDRAWWGSPALPRTWIRAVRQLAGTVNGDDLYWLLLTSGYRTYRFLPVFFRSFYPRCDEPMAPAMAGLLDSLAREKFGSQYDGSSGIVRFSRPQVLTPDLLSLPEGRVVDPHIAFFLSRNPGHVNGDELVCLTRVAEDNLTAAGRRMTRLPR